MAASAIDFSAVHEQGPEWHADSVRRTPFYLGRRDEAFFAWLHTHSLRGNVNHGVVICPPIGYEQIHSHRSLRLLGDRLATNKVPTLRFDWQGTGDSSGVDEDPHRIQTWLSNINQAVLWMRSNLGCHQISLIGLRMGATLAALATLENEIDNLVLWSPVTKGRSYVREMKALSLTAETPARKSSLGMSEIEAAGFILSTETSSDLSQIDLSTSQPQCRRMFVVSRSEHHDDDQLCNKWATMGLHVQQVTVDGYAEMMAVPHHSQVPHAVVRQIADWMTNEINVDAQSLITNNQLTRMSSISLQDKTLRSDSLKSHPRIRESFFKVKSEPELFGILSEPRFAVDPTLPTVVVLNAGCVHRVGPNRLNVFLARGLATQGFRCVRIDLSGFGDSIDDSRSQVNDSYPETAFRDIDSILKQIESDFKTDRIILTGLCSGAYASFQSAAQFDNPALVESILINPLTYFWREGMTLDESPTKHLTSFHYYQSIALHPAKWLKLLSGRTKIGVRGAMKLLARRFNLFTERTIAKPFLKSEKPKATGPSHPEVDDLPGDLKRVATAGRKLAMFFSANDPGFGILNYHARRQAKQLRKAGQLKIGFVKDADHTFTTKAARSDLIDAIAKHLCHSYKSE